MDDVAKEIIYKISSNPSINFLRYKPYYLHRDVYKTVSILFNIETALRLGHSVDKVEIPVSKETFLKWDIPTIEKELNELLKLVILTDVEIKIIKTDDNKGRWNKKVPFDQCEYICLFSGGVDSSTGIIKSLDKYGESVRSVFVCHGDQGKIGNIIEKIALKIKEKYHLNLDVVHAPKMHSQGYSQLRGFLYVMAGAIYADLRNASNILITECGPTMYQMRFSPFDSITMTTHPMVMSKTKKLINLFFGKDMKLIIPFENLTKAEVASINPLPEIFQHAHSCIGTRWIGSMIGEAGDARCDNCGTCYGCVVRRLGLITAGIDEAQYENDPTLDQKAHSDHIMNLLAFSVDVLLDYENIDDYSKENIEDYNKEELFHRFALDNIAALHILLKSGKSLNPDIEHFYNEVIDKMDKSVLDKRIEEVQSKSSEANFDKEVKVIE